MRVPLGAAARRLQLEVAGLVAGHDERAPRGGPAAAAARRTAPSRSSTCSIIGRHTLWRRRAAARSGELGPWRTDARYRRSTACGPRWRRRPRARRLRLVCGLAGNVSARSGELVAVTPTGRRACDARLPTRSTIVDLDGGPSTRRWRRPRSCRFTSRSTATTTAGAVVHTHPPMATAVACVADELPCIHYSLLALGGNVRVARYATFGTDRPRGAASSRRSRAAPRR